MPAPTARAIYDAAEQAIYDLIVDGKAEASFQGRSYKTNQLADLERARDYYKAQAVAKGALPSDPTNQVVQVSVAAITEN